MPVLFFYHEVQEEQEEFFNAKDANGAKDARGFFYHEEHEAHEENLVRKKRNGKYGVRILETLKTGEIDSWNLYLISQLGRKMEKGTGKREKGVMKMKFVGLFFGNPGKYLYWMFLWVLIWIPGEVHMVKEARQTYTVEHANKYLIPFILCYVFALGINFSDSVLHFWKNLNIWLKYILLNICYTMIAQSSAIVTEILRQSGDVNYVGDVFGTIVVLYWPTIILYWVAGIPITMFFCYKAKKTTVL